MGKSSVGEMSDKTLLGFFRCEGCWRIYGALTSEAARIPFKNWKCDCGGSIEEITPFMYDACR